MPPRVDKQKSIWPYSAMLAALGQTLENADALYRQLEREAHYSTAPRVVMEVSTREITFVDPLSPPILEGLMNGQQYARFILIELLEGVGMYADAEALRNLDEQMRELRKEKP